MNSCDEKTGESGGKALRAGIWYTISTVAVKAITVLTTPIYTRLLSTSDYGISSTFNSWYSMLLILCSLDLEMSVGRAKQDFRGDLERYIGAMQTLSAAFSMILLGIGLIFLKPVSYITELNPALVIVLFIYLFFAPAVTLAQTRYRYEYRYKENILILIYTTLMTILVSLFLILSFDGERYWGKVLGTVIPTVLLSSYFWYRGLKKRTIAVNIDFWKYGLTISAPMIIHSISLNVLATSDRVAITKLVGAEATGIYTLAYQYAILINIIMNAVNQAWQPWFHDNYYAGNYMLIKEKVKDLTFLGGFIGLGCAALTPEMIAFLGPKEYREGIWVVTPVVLGIVCQFVYTNYINIELHLKKTRYASWGTVTAAAVNIILNFIFIPKYGFIAAAYTTLISYIILFASHCLISKKILKVNLYDDLFFVKFLLGMGMMCAVFMRLYEFLIVRIILICFIGVLFAVHNRALLQGFLKKHRI